MTELEQKAFIFATIFTISNNLQVLGDEFDKNVTTKQWLFILGVSTFTEPPILSEVANLIGYSRQNAKRIAAAVAERGFVTISKDEHDGRALRIALTSKSRKYFIDRDKREIEFLEEIFNELDTETTSNLYKGLSRLAQNVKTLMKSNGMMILEKDSE